MPSMVTITTFFAGACAIEIIATSNSWFMGRALYASAIVTNATFRSSCGVGRVTPSQDRCLSLHASHGSLRAMLRELETWGWLPIAFALLGFAAKSLATLTLPRASRTTRLAASVVVAMTLVHASVGILGELGLVKRAWLLGTLVAVAAVTGFFTRRQPSDRLFIDAARAAPLAVGIVATTLLACVVSARLLPVWQWDAHGYHLPFVNLVLQHGGFAQLPDDVRYITTYPHNIELGMIWMRSMLPDDRLVDLARVPYGFAGALLTAALARELGSSRSLSVLAGAAWLTLPAVFLQLPTNYVDVGTAAALLGAIFFLLIVPPARTTLILGGLALGLFLGSKPSAPIAVVALAIIAAVRAWRAGQLGALSLAALATLVFGAQQYLVMCVRHGNPIWPVALKLGPVTLPGEQRVDELLAAGSAVPHATGSLLERLSVSWLAIDAAPVFDMKLGGFGLLFLIALPLAIFGLVRRRGWLLLVAAAVTLLSPDPAIPRYVLAFPALLLAVAATQFDNPRAERLALVTVLIAMGWQLWHAWPGLVGEGPPLARYLAMTDEERRFAIGPSGSTEHYARAWSSVGPEEAAAFDRDFEFPGLLWSPELRFPVYALPRNPSSSELEAFLLTHRVRVAAVGPENAERLERAGGWTRLFACQSADCAVFVRGNERWTAAEFERGSR